MTEKEAAKIVRRAGAKLRAAIIQVNGDQGDLAEITDLILGYDGYKRFELEGVDAKLDQAYKVVGAVMVDALLEMAEGDDTLVEMEKQGRGDEWVQRAKAGEVMRIC